MIKSFRLRFDTPLVERDLEEAKWNIIESDSGNFASDRRRPVLAVGAGSKSRVPKVVASTLGFGQKHDATDDVPLDTMNDPRKKEKELSNWEADLSRREREIKRIEDAIASVALAKILFPVEAKVAMGIAQVDGTSEFPLSGINKKTDGIQRTDVDLNEAPFKIKEEHLNRLRALSKTGVEIAGALKNVLAIAAGTVEGLNLGNNSMEALVSQGCSEIRWLATKMGAK